MLMKEGEGLPRSADEGRKEKAYLEVLMKEGEGLPRSADEGRKGRLTSKC